jgi:D-glycero-D-manno-heptose 1,7-bisphosphate phosphatase
MKRALFLDRDGVINVEKSYLYKVSEFEFIDGIFDLCRHYQNLGFIIIVVTNQSGIARNFYTENDFSKLTTWMIKEFKNQGITVNYVYYCPHHPEINGKCECRKPQPGMLLQAKKDFDVNLPNSIIIGDKERDIEAALNAGINETYLFDENGSVTESKATKIIQKLDDIWKKEKC